MNNSRLQKIALFPITAITAFSIVSLLIFLSFSRTKTVSMSAASATAKLSPESIREAASFFCSGISPNSQRKRQLVSRLGIVFHDVGFPSAAGCGFYFGSSLFRHFFLQKTANIFNFRRQRENGIALAFYNYGRDAYFNFCFYTGWNRMGQFKEYPIISRYFNSLFNSHGYSIA